MNDAEVREHVLDEAKKCVLQDRNSTYGKPEDNFRRIAELWTAYLNIRPKDANAPITPTDVAQMMVLMKMARLSHNPTHKDSWVDGIGYLACGAGIELGDPAQQPGTDTTAQSGPTTGKGVVTEYFPGIGNCVITDEASRGDFQRLSDAVLKGQARATLNLDKLHTDLIQRAYAKRPHPDCTCVAEAIANKQDAVKFGSCKVCQTHSTSSGSQS